MTLDQIVEAAEKAGFTRTHSGSVYLWLANRKDLEGFATVVATEDRERIAKLVEDMGIEGYGTLAIAAAIRAGGWQ